MFNKLDKDPVKDPEKTTNYPLDIKVLMAEDDGLNQALSRNVFKKIGWALDMASDGMMAVEKLKHADYDVVLMDLQMPGMNGFDATTIIRKEFAKPKADIPIIAITAEVQQTVLDQCFSTGMNDYLSKPFKVNELIAKVCQYARNVKTTPPAEAREEEPLNLDILYKMYGNNQVAVKQMVALFLSQTPERIAEIGKLIQAGDWSTLGTMCHKVKSAYAIVGSLAVRDELQRIELDCASNQIDPDKFQSILNKVIEMDTRLSAELRKIIEA